MISLEKIKESLGDLAKELSEEQIIKLRDQQDQMAEILFNIWLAEVNESKRLHWGVNKV